MPGMRTSKSTDRGDVPPRLEGLGTAGGHHRLELVSEHVDEDIDVETFNDTEAVQPCNATLGHLVNHAQCIIPARRQAEVRDDVRGLSARWVSRGHSRQANRRDRRGRRRNLRTVRRLLVMPRVLFRVFRWLGPVFRLAHAVDQAIPSLPAAVRRRRSWVHRSRSDNCADASRWTSTKPMPWPMSRCRPTKKKNSSWAMVGAMGRACSKFRTSSLFLILPQANSPMICGWQVPRHREAVSRAGGCPRADDRSRWYQRGPQLGGVPASGNGLQLFFSPSQTGQTLCTLARDQRLQSQADECGFFLDTRQIRCFLHQSIVYVQRCSHMHI